MHYTYVIYSLAHEMHYTGYTTDVRKRLNRHNSPNSKGWSKRYQPWELLFAEEFPTRREINHYCQSITCCKLV